MTEQLSPPETYSSGRTAPQLVSVDAAAAILGISRGGVYRLRRRGELTGIRVGCRLRFLLADLERLIERGRETSTAPGMREPGSLSGLKGSRGNEHGKRS